MKLNIIHMNLYAGNNRIGDALDEAFRHNADSIGFNEAYPWVDDGEPIAVRAKREKYRLFFGEDKRDLRRGFKDNPVLVSEARKDLGSIAILGCEASKPERIAPLRGINVQMYRKYTRKVAHISAHPHAAVAGKDAKRLDRAAEYSDFWDNMQLLMESLQRAHFDVILTGDFNLRVGQHVRNGNDPWKVLDKQLHYDHVGVDLDHVAWNPKRWSLDKQNDFHIMRKEITGSDHDGIFVRLETK